MNKKNKLLVRIFAAILAVLMVAGTCISLVYMIFAK